MMPYSLAWAAVNHRSRVPETRIPKSVPLRLIAVTIEDAWMSREGSASAFPIAMAMLRKN